MSERVTCEACGKDLAEGSTICGHCGWDLSTTLARPPRKSLLAQLAAGGWRVVVYGLILLLPIIGFMRLRTTGPGPDLATTLRWMAFGDGGRAAELETIHRMHEIASAASRYSIRENEMPPFDGDWAKVLAPAATARPSRRSAPAQQATAPKSVTGQRTTTAMLPSSFTIRPSRRGRTRPRTWRRISPGSSPPGACRLRPSSPPPPPGTRP